MKTERCYEENEQQTENRSMLGLPAFGAQRQLPKVCCGYNVQSSSKRIDFTGLEETGMSLQDAIARNRARQAEKASGKPTDRPNEHLRAFTVNVLIIPTVLDGRLFGSKPYEEKRTIYGTSLVDAKRRAGIE
jgi:hypothetical protein